MLNFTVGPVMSPEEVLEVSRESAPYFRTKEFSRIMLENEKMVLRLAHAPEESRAVFLTASGTGAMEAAVMGVLRPNERVVVVNGGGFGQRFCDLCQLHGHEVDEIVTDFGAQVNSAELEDIASRGASALLVNMCETSSGILYDMNLIASCCRRHGMLLIIDAVSSFIADELDMDALGADVVLTGSQKALACHPGASIVVMSPRAQERAWSNHEPCLYLSLREALVNGDRGQTPWTPAVTVMDEMNARLEKIVQEGIEKERERIASRALAIRLALDDTDLSLVARNPSNCVSGFWCPSCNAHEIVEAALRKYNIWLCPNGGKQAHTVFRIGHIGHIDEHATGTLLLALRSMHESGLF